MQTTNASRRLRYPFVALLAAALFTTGCDDDDDDGFTAGTTEVRVVHGVADAPLVNVYLDDDQVLENFDFREGTGYLSLPAGTYDIRVEAIVPGGNVDVINAPGVLLSRDERTTVYAAGDTSEGSIAPLLVADPVDPVAPGAVRATGSTGSATSSGAMEPSLVSPAA